MLGNKDWTDSAKQYILIIVKLNGYIPFQDAFAVLFMRNMARVQHFALADHFARAIAHARKVSKLLPTFHFNNVSRYE